MKNSLQKRESLIKGEEFFVLGNVFFEFRVNRNKLNYKPIICQKEGCSNIIPYEKRHNSCCSRGCANSRIKTDEIKLLQSVSAKNSKKVLVANKARAKNEEVTHKCKFCDNLITTRVDRKLCQKECRVNFNKSQRDINVLVDYRKACSFNFSLNDYPDSFDFSIIEKYGWYKAKNKGDNPNGVSRDHMYSVKEGFINNIDPQIIAHPANCRLITQRQNVSKGSNSAITIQELKEKIKNWNKIKL